jgi:hypothetical protein
MLELENPVHQFLVGQFRDISSRGGARVPQLHGGFALAGAGLEPEDLCRDIAGSGRVEQEARHLSVGLGLAQVVGGEANLAGKRTARPEIGLSHRWVIARRVTARGELKRLSGG